MTLMRSYLQHSLLLKLGGAMGLITFFSVVGMTASQIIADSTQGSAEAINLAGSLRMQSYRMASLVLAERVAPLEENRHGLRTAIPVFQKTLLDRRITAELPRKAVTDVSLSYRAVTSEWQGRMRPRFEAAARGEPVGDATALVREVTGFVVAINELVSHIERGTEAKILVMRMILGVALFMTVLVAALSLYLARIDLVLPLRNQLSCAGAVGRGDLSVRTQHTGTDELGRLGQAFNSMAEDLAKLYRDLESRVREKTVELTIANRSLALLYHSIARLYNGPVAPDTYAVLLADLENVLGVGHGIACLTEDDGGQARVLAATLRPDRGDPDVCGLSDCASCLGAREMQVRILAAGRRVLTLPLMDTESHYGVMQLVLPEGYELAPWQTQLLEALTRHIGIAIGTARRIEQHRRISLLDERGAIARELHDSLAQSLSYMKIQVSRLQLALSAPGGAEDAKPVLAELREGLNSAYRQLRELLTTFRLRIEGGGFGATLAKTVEEFSARGDISVTLESHLTGCPLSPNEEIHSLQVVREALSNVVHHSRARSARVVLDCGGDGTVSVTIEDDGIGIRKMADTHHYGLTIMEERARSLKGTLSMESPAAGGTRVVLRFLPHANRQAFFQAGLAAT